ncbi:MAG: virulence factor [Anaerolineales bacterium]|nr:virulence factor [Anaerolineales bacterium]
MAKYQILYWHDIPLQVKAQEGRTRVSKPLTDRFQIAVDNASMEAGLTGTDEYLNLMRWGEPQTRDGSPEEVVAALLTELETQYAKIDWRKTAKAVTRDA